ncbi:MAG: hypothetical protein DI563_05755 [Variovorax paradoxus]|uniref:OmpA-like domain-containing protein n=1 Tax=Variovorax paradoxus TaxID=34073 RepID=A0A2W5QEH8_VARPD|nr:MAG: hypothetical protein DI563_05755 [Variovorax paradoxus]
MIKNFSRTVLASMLMAGAAFHVHAGSEYWTAKAQCWRELAAAEAEQGDTHGTAAKASGNAADIVAALAEGRSPVESPIFATKVLPSDDGRYGRPKWRAEILQVDNALQRYESLRCKTPLSACLEVAVQSVYENLEESGGARWNHGRPELDKALALAAKAGEDMSACEATPAPLAVAETSISSNASFSADALFAFDDASLSGPGRTRLRDFASRVHDAMGAGSIRVVGHTDRLGDAEYNAQLSRARAAAVGEFLKALLPGAHVITEGRGSAEPIVSCDRLIGAHAIACLAPNRRVTVQTINAN